MGGIGTRRWAKLSKEFCGKGYEVHVLTAHYPYEDKVSWKDDLPETLHIHNYKSKYPPWLLKGHSTRFSRFFSRAFGFFLKKSLFYIDEAQYDTREILRKAKEIVKNEVISNVIATGHPVSINHAAAILKCDIPSLNLIQDFRDNWNDLSYYSFPGGLSNFRRKLVSVDMEQRAITYSNYVVNVTRDLTEVMSQRYQHISKSKFHTIYNFFDMDDYKSIGENKSVNFCVSYFGSLYNNRIEAIYKLLDAIEILDDEYLNTRLKFLLYTNFPQSSFDEKYKNHIGVNVFFKKMIPPNEVPNKILESYTCLSINSQGAEYAFGTKIFEYMALNRNILHISNGGELSELLSDSGQLTSSYDLEELAEVLLILKERFLSVDETSYGNSLNERFSLRSTANQFEELFK